MKKILLLILILMLVALVIWPLRLSIFAQYMAAPSQPLITSGSWDAHNYDLIYTVAFSSEAQQDGPLVVYRASATDLHSSVPVIAIQRTDVPPTPLFFPSPDGQYLALLSPVHGNVGGTSLNGEALSVLPTDGHASDTRFLVADSAEIADQVIWSADSRFLYYQRVIETGVGMGTSKGQVPQEGHPQGLFTRQFQAPQDLAPTRGATTCRAAPLLPIGQQLRGRGLGAKRCVVAPLVGARGDDRTSVGERDQQGAPTGVVEIHRVGLDGRDVILLHFVENGSSLRLIGVDRTGGLILTLARQGEPVQLLRMQTDDNTGMAHPVLQNSLHVVATLPGDILPGNVLRVGSDGASVECERVLSWQPLRYTLIRIGFERSSGWQHAGHTDPAQPPSPLPSIETIMPLFDTHRFGNSLSPLSRSTDGQVLVMSQGTSVRQDLAAEGISGVPAQEALLLADTRTGGTQRLALPNGGQIVQVFWTGHLPLGSLQVVPQSVLNALLAFHRRAGSATTRNASVFQQDEWMLEGHAGKLFDAPVLPKMCYGNCPNGLGAPHVSAAILHGVAYVESNWHQFNTSDYSVNGEPPGTPVKSWDGGWGEYQQTWGMPPQCKAASNCRTDVYKVQHDQSYNIGVGVASLINAWNYTAGVASSSDPNDPYKANHWFFATWAYNGASGNNPNDIPSSEYGHWYPGAPFRSVYEEYVWYFAAHPQYTSNGWTDNYLPSLGTSLLPPQSDFTNTSDSFVGCVTCTIPDWTPGSYDRDWVGMGAPNAVANDFKTNYASLGGEKVVGLPRDNAGGAAVHRWGNGWAQDFGGGSDHPGTLMLADGTTPPYWVYGSVWIQYLTVDHGATGCHGYPTSMLAPFSNAGPGSDSYLRQNFHTGYIIWDATTNMMATDVCG